MPASRLWTPFGWAVHLKMGARVWIFDIRTNGNMLKILMCCITDIHPNDSPEFPSTTLYYMNYFVNCQTNNTKYSSNVYGNKHEHSGIYWVFCQRYQTNNKLLNIVIWKYLFNQVQTQNTKNLRTPKVVKWVFQRRVVHNLVAGKSHQAGIRFVTLGEN